MDAMTVFWLTDAPESTPAFIQETEYILSDAFQAFCHDTFTASDPLDYPALRIIPVATPEALEAALFRDVDQAFMTTEACRCCLFILDDTVAGKHVFGHRLEGLTLPDWFLTYFPAIPKILVTRPGHPRPPLPSRRWVSKPFAFFARAAAHRDRIEHLFASFWKPRFWGALRGYVRRRAGTNWHTPGHNGGNAFARSPFLHGFHDTFSSMIFRTDLSVSVASLGDLSTPEGHTPLSEAQRLTSEIFGSAQTCYVTNGTSTSNKAMLMTLLRPGERVLLDRNCHKSVHHAVVMAGAVPRYLPAHFNPRLKVWGPVALDELRRELAAVAAMPEAGKPRMLILTTCTYEGIAYPVWEIGRLCEEAGLLFYADEAWAPYFAFHPYYTHLLPDGSCRRYNAVSELGGAHVSVQSTHKALAAFSQASMVHVSIRFKRLLEEDARKQFRWLRRRFHLHGHGSYEKFSHDLHEVLRYWHSTSPHYPTLATLDTAAIQMRLEGLSILEERLRWVADFRARVAALLGRPESECFAALETVTDGRPDWRDQGYFQDPLKMILMFRNRAGCEAFKKSLLESHIQWEKSTAVTILFLVTAGTVREHFDYLYRCIRRMPEVIGLPEETEDDALLAGAIAGQPAVLPRDAALCDGELLPLEACEGRIASQLLVPYPPGIPVFLPGLVITRPMIDLIRRIVDEEGPDAVHGLFVRGRKCFVEVLNRDEETRVLRLATPSR